MANCQASRSRVNRVLLELEASGGGFELLLALELPVLVDAVEELERGLVAVAENGAVVEVMLADGELQRRIGDSR